MTIFDEVEESLLVASGFGVLPEGLLQLNNNKLIKPIMIIFIGS
jgi:hypothetical protein